MKKSAKIIISLISIVIIIGVIVFIVFYHKTVIEEPSTIESVHNHTFSSDWSYDKESHYHQAICGHDLVRDSSLHEYSAWTITKEPSSTELGEKTRVCLICGFSETESIEKLIEEIPVYIINQGILQDYHEEFNENPEIIIIPNEVIRISSQVFFNNQTIKKVILPDQLQYIENNAFNNCHNLEEVILPLSVTNIGGSAFSGCEKLSKVFYLGDEETFLKINKTNHSFDSTSIIYYYSETKTDGNYWHFENNLPVIN